MLLKIDRFSSLLVTAWVAAVVGYGCGGTTPTNDASADGKKDVADSGSGGKVGSGGSGGKGGSGGTGGTIGGDGGSSVTDAPVDHPDVATDHPADAPVDTVPDAGLDIHPDAVDAGTDAAVDHGSDVAAEAAPEVAPETAPEVAPETSTGTDTGTDTTVDDTPSAPDTGTPAFVAISPCDTAVTYTTAPPTITFPTNGSPMQYQPACLKVSAGASVTWQGDLATTGHPLQPRSDPHATADNPITLTTTSAQTAVFSFSKPGFFPFECRRHPGVMMGVIWVTD
ncbi:MAG TPA: plastocyanin/azurin family copper-binding protein [Polyangia bacterium]|jgi:plastocyanin|nr:plastocyanin/azurin family copper-binding protein [Polyangia bacterium]